jgi:hypothetical protein
LTIFVNRFYTDHTPFKVPDVGSRWQWCVKTIDVLNFDHYPYNSREEKDSNNHRSYFAKRPTMLQRGERLRKSVVHHVAITLPFLATNSSAYAVICSARFTHGL